MLKESADPALPVSSRLGCSRPIRISFLSQTSNLELAEGTLCHDSLSCPTGGLECMPCRPGSYFGLTGVLRARFSQ